MIVSGVDIKKYLEKKSIIVKPYQEEDIGPVSIDVHVGEGCISPYAIRRKENLDGTVDSYKPRFRKQILKKIKNIGSEVDYEKLPDDPIVIKPRQFVLLTTNEYIQIPDFMVGFIVGKSSIARIGLSIEAASIIQPGFGGNITLEVYNHSNMHITIHKGDPIGQLYFELLTSTAVPYTGKYQWQCGPTGSKG